ncbi:DNA binding domain-containing protein, excisionase family [Salegentibacter agarivorans]|uniref:DNA binding domain-containing protein, excisionase family n=1 Tax=Salegentibacter agarivorans TaxID=345907 RepID=A0A1I2MX56_9FLAO|nr:helix-turn-helix domain-containing protein [Salegentibacter agarivorans]SFF96023.1 DNA binding domain-containing protein, excisionase family [Salegentibacter agarivorans]
MKAESILDIIQSLEPSERKRLDSLLNVNGRHLNNSQPFTERNFKKWSIEAHILFDANNTCLSVAECAEFLSVHHNTVKNKLHSREIKGTLIGRVWSIPKIQFLDKIIN